MPLGSENEIEDEDDDDLAPLRVTFHVAPVGRPVSVNVTEYLTWVNVICSFSLVPLTMTVPEDGVDEYPETEFMENEYVPSGTENVIEDDVDDSVVPLNITDHDVPGGRPDSVNVTLWGNIDPRGV